MEAAWRERFVSAPGSEQAALVPSRSAREFYLYMAVQARWGKRELERQTRLDAFERTVLKLPKLSPTVRVVHGDGAPGSSKNSESLSRTHSPAPGTQYQAQLPDKRLLATKLHEFYAGNVPAAAPAVDAARSRTKQGGPR